VAESTKYAPGELALLAFAEAWDAYCKQHKLAWPAPKIVVEQHQVVWRFTELRVSVWTLGVVDYCLLKIADEANANWVPVVWDRKSVPEHVFCDRLASVLDRRIPW
jgi:hypothetical protein